MKSKRVSIIRILLAVFGVIFIVNAVVYAVFCDSVIGSAATMVIGVVFLLSGIFWQIFLKLPKWIRAAYYICILLLAFLLAFVMIFGSVDTASYDEDAVIVLGVQLKEDDIPPVLASRLEKAVEYNQRNPDAVIILSGGRGESLAMKEYLLERGVEEGQIITEERSENTYQNFDFCKQMISSMSKEGYEVAVITSDYHAFRSSLIADEVEINTRRICADSPFYLLLPNLLRELVGLIRFFLLGY